MARRSPLFTLLGGAVLAAGLLVANPLVTAAGPDDPERADGELAAAGASPAAASPTADPSPAASAEPEEDAEPVTYVGNVDGGGASVAIVIHGDEAVGYVCDGVTEAWLRGPAGAGSPGAGELALRGERGVLAARYDQASATGEVTADGQTWTFTVPQVAPPEGLYRVADTILGGAEVDGGWIVLPDGTQIGVLTVDGQPQPAPALDPRTGQVTIDGAPVTADRVG